MEKKRLTLLAVLLVCINSFAQTPACVHEERNVLRRCTPNDNIDVFLSKLDSCVSLSSGTVNILHLGDSHIQAEFFPDRMRRKFLGLKQGMEGIRGLLFPYSFAGTNYLKDYTLTLDGEWTCHSLFKPEQEEIGLSGRVAVTEEDGAKLSITLNTTGKKKWNFSVIRILGYSKGGKVCPLVESAGKVFRGVKTEYGYIIDLGSRVEHAEISLEIEEGGSFVLSGIIPDIDAPSVKYLSSGVNGARVDQWARCPRLFTDMQAFVPDLAIIALGTNDAAVPQGQFDSLKFCRDYNKLIKKIRTLSPSCAVILVPANDIIYKGEVNINNNAVQRAVYKVAKESSAAIWDWYDIMGGAGSVYDWQKEELMGGDGIHMTAKGYNLSADLMFSAIMKERRR